jgi:Ran GTPase-activating protein (RanGAP) involved in mRNA processing and transport
LLLAADAFVAALGSVLAEDWCRTWAAGRTIMLRRTSKRVKEVVDKMRLPAVVRLSRSFWDDARNGTEEAKLEFVLRQLAAMTAWCRITTLELPECKMKGQDAERLAGVLWQCRELLHLNLSRNRIGEGGAAGLAGVLPQCTALAHLDLSYNGIEAGGTERLAGVLAQCTALAHLNLRSNQIGPAGAERLAGVLAQCPALAHLNFCGNWIGIVGEGRLRASWCGQASGLVL